MSPALTYIIFVKLANNKLSQRPWNSDRTKPHVRTVFPLYSCLCLSEDSVLFGLFFVLGNCPSTSCHGQLELLQHTFPAGLFYDVFCFVLLIELQFL